MVDLSVCLTFDVDRHVLLDRHRAKQQSKRNFAW
jgi:hypothetical protein